MSLRMEYRSVSFSKEHRYVVKPDFWIYDWLKIAFNECEQTDYSTNFNRWFSTVTLKNVP